MSNLAYSSSRASLFLSALLIGTAFYPLQTLAAFDPNSGADSVTTTVPALPDTRLLTEEGVRGYAPYVAPVTTIQLPQRPLYPARSAAAPIEYAPAAAVAQSPALPAATIAPAVTPATISDAAAPAPTSSSGFIAPAPVFAPALTASPVVAAAPVTIAPTPTPQSLVHVVVAPKPATASTASLIEAAPQASPVAAPLSRETKTILSAIPSCIDTPVQDKKPVHARMDRISPDVQSILGKDARVESYESVGISIKVSRPGLDTNYELGRAYAALMGGDTEAAVQIYKDILSADNTNQDALFGLGATYHQLGQLNNARPLYGALLKLNPQHREGLNNFLALISEEAPEEALAELARLEERNPRFSPIPAQSAILLDKLGFVLEAREKMLRAIDLAPENLTYKYNLAVMLDRQGQYADAGALYRLLIDAALKGAIIPGSSDALQRRLNYITTASKATPSHGG